MSRHQRPCVALLTDFGTRDWYVGTLKGVLLSLCPRVHVVDITHDIPPQDVIAGAFTLSAVAHWFPPGTVFLTVVDPGVGSRRALLAAEADQRYFVGPDNGVLTLSLERAKRLTIVRLTNRRYWLNPVSHTFHGRDILAPVAAHLASGRSLRALGVVTRRITSLSLPTVQRTGRTMQGCLVHIDAFGNLITNVPGAALRGRPAHTKRVLRYKRRWVRVVSSYADGRPNELIAVIGSLGFVELAIREGSAAWTFRAKRGDRVELFTETP